MEQLDLQTLFFFNQTIAQNWLDKFFAIYTDVHWWIPVYIVAAVYLIWKYQWRGVRLVLVALVAVALTDSVCHLLLKPLVGRLRPCALLPNGQHVVSWIRLPIGTKWDPSFPSNHAANNFAAATFFSLALLRRGKGSVVLFALAAFMAIARVYEGVHYPSDVLSGALLGLLIGFGFSMALRSYERRAAATKVIPESLATPDA